MQIKKSLLLATLLMTALFATSQVLAQNVRMEVEKETIPTYQIGAPEVNPILPNQET